MQSSKNHLFFFLLFAGTLSIQSALIQNDLQAFDENSANASLPAVSGTYVSDISTTDLINSGQPTLLSFTSTGQFFGPNELNDGDGGGGNTSQGTYFDNGRLPATVTFTLDITTNTQGYDISGITTIAGWHKNGSDLANQEYELLVSLVGSADFLSLGSFTNAPFTAAQGYNTGASKIELSDDAGSIATRVDEVRFVFVGAGDDFGAVNGVVYQEVDVIGSPTAGVIPQTLTVSSLSSRQVVQRDFSGQASITVAGTFTGSATEVQAQAIAIDGNGIDTGWITIDSAPSGASYAGQLAVTQGWYQLETRLLENTTEVDSVVINPIGVGDIFITAGQSNAANFGESPQSADDNRISYFRVGASWTVANDPPNSPAASIGSGGSPWPELGDLIAAAEGIPVSFVPIGDGSSSILDWLPTTNDNYPNLQAAVQAFGSNGFKAVLWHQGERDSQFNPNNFGVTPAQYTANLETIIATSRADAGWDIPWGVALVGFSREGRNLDADLRGAQLAVSNNDSNVFLGADTDDLIGVNPANNRDWRHDAVHLSNAGLNEHAARWFSAIQAFDTEPVFEITDFTLSGNAVTLQFTGAEGHSYQLRKSLLLTDNFPSIVAGPITLLGSSSGSLTDSDADNGGTTDRAFYVVEEMP